MKFPASVSLADTMSERVKEVIFNDEYPEQFALTTDYHVLFLVWVGKILQLNAFIGSFSCQYERSIFFGVISKRRL